MTETTITTNARKIKNIINMAGNYTSYNSEGTLIELLKGGLILSAINKTCTTMVLMSINKDNFEEYNFREEQEITLEKSDITKILKAMPEDNKKIIIKIKDEKSFRITYDKIKRKITLEKNKTIIEQSNGAQKTIENITEGLETIGTMEETQIKEFAKYLKHAESFKGHGNKVTRITKQGDEFTIDTEITEEDNLILNLKNIITTKTKTDLNLLYMSEELAKGIAMIKKITDEITILGKENYPIILACNRSSPKDARDFTQLINVWWALAPRVEPDE